MDFLVNTDRRRELQQITDRPVEEHAAAVGALSASRPEIVALAKDVRQGNCYAFAFDLVDVLHDDPVVSRLARVEAFGLDVIPDGCFVRWLWVNGFIEPDRDGPIVVYFERGGRPVHAAKAEADGRRAVSKWGTGHVWRHAIDAVPSSYGQHVSRVSIAAPWTGLSLYRKYLKTVYPVVLRATQKAMSASQSD